MKKLLYSIFICIYCAGQAYTQKPPEATKSGVPGYSPSMFYYAVIYRDALGLPYSITDTLNARAAYAKERKLSDPGFNISEYEHKIIKSLLTDGQYISLLVLKNKPVAAELTARVWAEMIKTGLVSLPDSSDLQGTINAHLLTTLLTREYLSDKPEEQQKYLSEMDRKAPRPLYEYFHHGYDKPLPRNLHRAEFIW